MSGFLKNAGHAIPQNRQTGVSPHTGVGSDSFFIVHPEILLFWFRGCALEIESFQDLEALSGVDFQQSRLGQVAFFGVCPLYCTACTRVKVGSPNPGLESTFWLPRKESSLWLS
jgi:hypothetical protein